MKASANGGCCGVNVNLSVNVNVNVDVNVNVNVRVNSNKTEHTHTHATLFTAHQGHPSYAHIQPHLHNTIHVATHPP